jgi:hypothetical protein
MKTPYNWSFLLIYFGSWGNIVTLRQHHYDRSTSLTIKTQFCDILLWKIFHLKVGKNKSRACQHSETENKRVMTIEKLQDHKVEMPVTFINLSNTIRVGVLK